MKTVSVLFLAVGVMVPLHAGSVTFDFNSLVSGAGASAIQTYMQSKLPAGQTVTVSGGPVAETTYNGDGHVVGPCSGGTCTSQTLGTDTFIRNVSTATSFSFTFNLPGVIIDSASFDYEIFPDGTCPILNAANCGGTGLPNRPDFTFSTNLGQVFHDYSATPVSPGYTHSPISGTASNELAPQKLVVGGGPWATNVAGATTLTFTDWPATIGIDNLTVNYHSSVPEPMSVLLLGTVAGIVVSRLRRRAGSQA